MIHELRELLFGRIEKNKKVLEDALLTGRVKSMEDYKFIIGQLRGLDMAASDVKQAVDTYLGNV